MTQVKTSKASPQSGVPAWKSIARALFIVATAGAAAILLAKEWTAILAALSTAHVVMLAIALLASGLNVIMTGISWRALLADAPVRLSLRQSAQVFFLGQIGKYLPGTIWSFLASAELAKQAGFARATAVSSLLLALIIGLGTGVVLALTILPNALNVMQLNWYVAALGMIAPLLLAWGPTRQWLLKRAKIDFPVSGASLLFSSGAAVAGWLLAGTKIALISQAIGFEPSWIFFVQATGIYALAWIAGLLFFIAPAGLGAREGVLVTLLSVHMPLSDALIVALLSRLVMTISDFLLAGLAGLFAPIEPGKQS